MRKLILVAVLTGCCQTANATTGSDLKQARDYDSDFFQGYVTGVLEAGEDEWWCPQGVVEKDELIALVSQYINDHPDLLHKNAGDVIIPPVIKQYPCKKKKRR